MFFSVDQFPNLDFLLRFANIKAMKYIVILRKSKYGYDIHAPALPGCHSQGRTEKEALENIRDAIKTYIGMDLAEAEGTKVKVRELEVVAA